MQEQEVTSAPLGVRLAGGYAAILAVLILVGIPASFIGDYPDNAVRMPVISLLIAAGLGAAAWGLRGRQNWGRLAFFVVAPWGSLALASGFAGMLWRNDIPYTLLGWILFAPLTFMLSRPIVLSTLGVVKTNWIGRGAALLLGLTVLMLLARWGVMASKPSGTGGFLTMVVAMNDYVKRLVITVVPFWHYAVGFIAALIPAGGLDEIRSWGLHKEE